MASDGTRPDRQEEEEERGLIKKILRGTADSLSIYIVYSLSIVTEFQ